MQNIIQTVDSNVNSILQNYVQKPTLIRGLVHLLLMLYVVKLAPQPPAQVLRLFENIYFKLFVFSMVLWTAQFSPSTSLLIALAFLVTMNYINTGKVWEYMDNITVAAIPEPEATPTAPAAPSTVEAAPAVPEPAPTAAPSTVEAVAVLARGAMSSSAISSDYVLPLANIVAASTTTQKGTDAVKALAEQAMVAQAGDNEKVQAAVQDAVQSIQQQGGCYPARQYDMNLVNAQLDGVLNFEDYQPFSATPQ